MSKKLYRIRCEWAVIGTMLVEANSLQEAIDDAENLPLPEAADYVEGSFMVIRESIPYLNNNLTDEEKELCG